jgi:SWI/SNF-related matrix-associated actin-dependent regulator of chromatin subfamily A3
MSQQVVPQSISTKVVSVTFGNRQATIQQLAVGEAVVLQREPYNTYDPNAICVERGDGSQIGYIPKELAAQLARKWDVQGITSVPATVTALTGGYSHWASRGVQIKFSRI